MDANRKLLDTYVERYNGGDLDGFMDLYADDAVQGMPDGTEVPPTSKHLEVQGMEVVRVRDGKIVLNTLYYDMLSVVAQMGLLPESASA